MKAKVAFTIVLLTLCVAVFAEDEVKEKNAPEIVYIHYSTPEEAELARKQILAQYEALGGSATIVHEELPDLSAVKEEEKSTTTTEANASKSS